jgi:hypothetical protein
MGEDSAATDVRQTFNVRIGPQPGPQSLFLSSSVDIAIYGAVPAAGKRSQNCSSRFAMSATRTSAPSSFGRTTPQITNEGALWDESGKLYPLLGAKPIQAAARLEKLEVSDFVTPESLKEHAEQIGDAIAEKLAPKVQPVIQPAINVVDPTLADRITKIESRLRFF